MRLNDVSQWLDNVTQPQHPYYHLVQVTLFGGITYINAACFTSTPPKRAASFMVITYAVIVATNSFFREIFEPYQNITLIPFTKKVIHISSAITLSKILYSIAGKPITLVEIRSLGLLFLISWFVLNLILLKFRQNQTSSLAW